MRRWIGVSDALPPAMQNVLVITVEDSKLDGGGLITRTLMAALTDEGDWRGAGITDEATVVAWQPLPPRPSKEWLAGELARLTEV